MTKEETTQLLGSLATLGAAIAGSFVPVAAGTFALGAIVREAPHLIGIASVLLANGEPTAEQKAEAHGEALALSGGIGGIPAADLQSAAPAKLSA